MKLTPTVTNPTTGETHTPDPGCYIEGHRGQFGMGAMLRLVDSLLGTDFWREAYRSCIEQSVYRELVENNPFGPVSMETADWFVDNATDRLLLIGHDDSVDNMSNELYGWEEVGWVADDAEAKLNDATINGRWGWEDGEFFLVANYETDTTVFHGGRDWNLADLGPVWCLWYGGSGYAAPDPDTDAVRFDSLLAALNAHDEAYRGHGFWNHEGEYTGDTPGVTDNCRTLVFLTNRTHDLPDFEIKGVDLSEGYETEWAEDNEGEMVWTVSPA